MAQLPLGAGPFITRFGQPTAPAPKSRGTAPAVTRPVDAAAPVAPAAPPGEAVARGPLSQVAAALDELSTASASNAAALGEIRGALDRTLARVAGFLDGLKATHATTVEMLGCIGDAVAKPIALSPETQQQLSTAVGYFGRMAAALEKDGGQQTGATGEPALCGAILALAFGTEGALTSTAEAGWFERGGCSKLADVANLSKDDFVGRMDKVRAEKSTLPASRLVNDAKRSDLELIHEAARIAQVALSAKAPKSAAGPAKT